MSDYGQFCPVAPGAEAMRDGDVEVHGAPHHRKALPSWLGVTRFAGLAKRVSTLSR